MKTNDGARQGREGEKEYRKVIYWRTLVKKITTIPEKKIQQTNSSNVIPIKASWLVSSIMAFKHENFT